MSSPQFGDVSSWFGVVTNLAVFGTAWVALRRERKRLSILESKEAERELADHRRSVAAVTVWPVAWVDERTLSVVCQNLTEAPVFDVTLRVKGRTDGSVSDVDSKSTVLPPGERRDVLIPILRRGSELPLIELYFSVAEGRYWLRNGSGLLSTFDLPLVPLASPRAELLP
jgi:hypothetical protein